MIITAIIEEVPTEYEFEVDDDATKREIDDQLSEQIFNRINVLSLEKDGEKE